ncbi:MAG: hypothetical protein AB2693_25665 [Candidatus Thiodiazotropha sp.]
MAEEDLSLLLDALPLPFLESLGLIFPEPLLALFDLSDETTSPFLFAIVFL